MPMTGNEDQRVQSQRLDKWLWFARITKSRTLAAQLIEDGKVRINRTKAAKASQTVRSGDVLTIAVRGSVEVLKVLAPGVRRGPPPEARLLYEAISSPGRGSGAQPAVATHFRRRDPPRRWRHRRPPDQSG